MKPSKPTTISALCLLLGALAASHAQAQSTNLQLRLERRTNTLDLMVNGTANSGAFFIYQAQDLPSLSASPSVAVQTNTALTNGLRFSLPAPGVIPSQAFFSAAHWPGLSVDNFGDPEFAPNEPSPEEVLITSGVPTNLISGQAFTVDFFVTDTAGQLLDITQAVSIRVLRQLDGVSHPDAQVSPSTGQMIGGHLRLTITVTATTPLNGYTLGLGPAVTLFSRNLTQFLKTSFNLGTAPLSTPTSNQLYQALEARRTAAADPNPAWSYPLAGANYPIAGTFGEWRGDDNTKVHKGVDLAASVNINVIVSRGGIVSHRGSLLTPAQGDYLVIDHGDGWFSRYLHLQASSIAIKVGDSIARGATLATSLYSRSGWGTHLHFEIRRGANHSQWQEPFPGSAQDPLQIATINPGSSIFAGPPGVRLPELEEFGLTRKHPGQNAFDKANTTIAETTGPVYVYARFLDREPKIAGSECDPNFYRLGLRSIGFQPENVTTNNWIWPSNEVAVASYLPASSGNEKGFAKYRIPNPQRCDYFRYWWKWDTSIYTNATGPRSIVLTGVDYGGAISNYTFTFGPQILAVVPDPSIAGKFSFTNVSYLGTNSLPALTQPDRYKVEIIQSNGSVLPGVIWTSPIVNGLIDVTAHLKTNGYTFTLPSQTDTTRLKLRVSSLLATNLAHQMEISGTALIPVGTFTMGDTFGEGYSDEVPTHTVQVSAFYMDKYEVTKTLWDDAYSWATNHGYSFDYSNSGQGKAANHPAHSMTWYDAVKWCNARSEKEGKTPAYYTSAAQTAVYRTGQVSVDNAWVKWNSGYRLPTEAEWEKAARGGQSGQRFPWGNTISWSQANYYAYPSGYSYDVNPTQGYNPAYTNGGYPYTSPVGSFAANGYGLYDMAGNVWEWCWDMYDAYSAGSVTDPRGPASGSNRMFRGGSWGGDAIGCWTAYRVSNDPSYRGSFLGFRSVLPPGQP